MKQINGAAFRKRLSQHMNECELSGEPLLVVTQKAGGDNYQHMVVISKTKYDELIENNNKAD